MLGLCSISAVSDPCTAAAFALAMTEETPLRADRAGIYGEVFKIDGKEVVLMGGNYVVKAREQLNEKRRKRL